MQFPSNDSNIGIMKKDDFLYEHYCLYSRHSSLDEEFDKSTRNHDLIKKIHLKNCNFHLMKWFKTFYRSHSRCSETKDNNEGFYLSSMGTRQLATLAMYANGSKVDADQMQIHRPNVGMLSRLEYLSDIKNKSRKVSAKQAEQHWNQQFNASEKMCVHMYWHGTCNNTKMGYFCDVSRWAIIWSKLNFFVIYFE